MLTITHLQVELLQSSNKRDPNLKVNHQETIVTDKVIKFYHTENDFSKMIRAYIDAVTSTTFFLFHFYILIFFSIYFICHAISNKYQHISCICRN